MGTITISVEDAVEENFRKTASEANGKGKGILGKAVTEAMREWVEKKRQQKIVAEMLVLLDNGFEMGKLEKINRNELHER